MIKQKPKAKLITSTKILYVNRPMTRGSKIWSRSHNFENTATFLSLELWPSVN